MMTQPTLAPPPVRLGIIDCTARYNAVRESINSRAVNERPRHLTGVRAKGNKIYCIDQNNRVLIVSSLGGFNLHRIVLDFEAISLCIGQDYIFIASREAVYAVRDDSAACEVREVKRLAPVAIQRLEYYERRINVWNDDAAAKINIFDVTESTDLELKLEPYDGGLRQTQIFGAFSDVRVGNVTGVKVTDDHVVVCDNGPKSAAYLFNHRGFMNFILRPDHRVTNQHQVDRGVDIKGKYLYLSECDKIHIFDNNDRVNPHKFVAHLPPNMHITGLQIMENGILGYNRHKVFCLRLNIHLPGSIEFETFGYHSPEFTWADPTTPVIPAECEAHQVI